MSDTYATVSCNIDTPGFYLNPASDGDRLYLMLSGSNGAQLSAFLTWQMAESIAFEIQSLIQERMTAAS